MNWRYMKTWQQWLLFAGELVLAVFVIWQLRLFDTGHAAGTLALAALLLAEQWTGRLVERERIRQGGAVRTTGEA
jgi:hypothetical protein